MRGIIEQLIEYDKRLSELDEPVKHPLPYLLLLLLFGCGQVEAQEADDEHCWSPGWNQPLVCEPAAEATAEAQEFQSDGRPSGVAMSAGLMNPRDRDYPDPYVLISWDTVPDSVMWVAIDFEKSNGLNARIYGHGTDVFRYDKPSVRGNGWIWLPNEAPALRNVGCEVGENFIRLTLTCMNSYTPARRQYRFERDFLEIGQTYTAQVINIRSKGSYSDFYSPQVRTTVPIVVRPTATPRPRTTTTPTPRYTTEERLLRLESTITYLEDRVRVLENQIFQMQNQ